MPEDDNSQKGQEEAPASPEQQGPLGPEALAKYIDEHVVADFSKIVTVDYPSGRPQLPRETVVPSTIADIASMEVVDPTLPIELGDHPGRRSIACFESEDTEGRTVLMMVYKEFSTDAQGNADSNQATYTIHRCIVPPPGRGGAIFTAYQWDMDAGRVMTAPSIVEGTALVRPQSPGLRSSDDLVTDFRDSGGLHTPRFPLRPREYAPDEKKKKIEAVGGMLRELVDTHSTSSAMLQATAREYRSTSTRSGNSGLIVKEPPVVDQSPPAL